MKDIGRSAGLEIGQRLFVKDLRRRDRGRKRRGCWDGWLGTVRACPGPWAGTNRCASPDRPIGPFRRSAPSAWPAARRKPRAPRRLAVHAGAVGGTRAAKAGGVVWPVWRIECALHRTLAPWLTGFLHRLLKRLEQRFRRFALADKGVGSRSQRLVHVLSIHRKHNDFYLRPSGFDAPGGFQPVHLRHTDVHQHEVRRGFFYRASASLPFAASRIAVTMGQVANSAFKLCRARG